MKAVSAANPCNPCGGLAQAAGANASRGSPMVVPGLVALFAAFMAYKSLGKQPA
ncbi:hypothetical protein IIA16_03310 [bacterium]|nr:hypothetical protein [bacterium]